MLGVKKIANFFVSEVYNNFVTFIPRDGILAELLLQCLEVWITHANTSDYSRDACLLPFALLTGNIACTASENNTVHIPLKCRQ